MVRAILSGTKTQTRRLCKIQPDNEVYYRIDFEDGILTINYNQIDDNPKVKAPYAVGDVLWVRESFYEPLFENFNGKYFYKADLVNQGWHLKWKSPRYMPKEAARIYLIVTKVYPQMLRFDITNDEALKEGVIQMESGGYMDYLEPDEFTYTFPTGSFRTLWDKIHGEGSFDSNPLVWVIEFEVKEAANHEPNTAD